MRPKMMVNRGICVVACVLAASASVTTAQSPDDSQSRPPVSKADVLIVQRARQILNSPEKWNRADNRICPAAETKFSLYCALEKATDDVTHNFAHRGAAMQEARFVIDDDLAPHNHYEHRLKDYNNDPRTTFADVQRFFDLLEGRIEGRLAAEEGISQPMTARGSTSAQSETVTETDLEIVRKVQAILDSPAKWDKASSQNCSRDAKTYGLYCAFEAASIAVTGRADYSGPAIEETRQLISSTAPNGAHYSARLVDYNNDPATTFEDLHKLLQTVESDLEKSMAQKAK